jgi:AraC-like DNA-binding protein
VGLHFVFDESEYGGHDGIDCIEKKIPGCPIEPLPPPYLRSRLSRPIFNFCKDLALSYISSPNGRVLEKKGLLFLLFQAWREEIERPQGRANVSRRHLLLVEKAESALCVDLKESPSWGEIAAELQVSKRYLSDLFRSHTGMGFKGYLREQRLVEARRLLTEGTMTISEVAYAVGFNDPFYFSQEFSRRFKLSPTAFRQQFRTI